ncbi:hypothetical protein [Oceanobacillus sojae]|uniref:hypothetical protein n=1 Tax=Oceanobacillus sojae TaxID=582851 RepID=UPI00363DC997
MKQEIVFATIGSIMTIVFLMIVNLLTSPEHLWFLYPSHILVLWPVSLYFLSEKQYKFGVLFVGLVIILFLSLNNYFNSPGHPWVLYAVYSIILLVVLTFLGKSSIKLSVAIIGSLAAILYYSFLNYYLSPGYPWAVYLAYAVLWWPTLLYFISSKRYFGLSIFGTFLTVVFLIVVSAVSTPNVIWEVYPIFLILWWPLSMYFYGSNKRNSRNKIIRQI